MVPEVLAIGGSASVGKTTVALHLSADPAVDVVHVDDLRRGPSFLAVTPDVWHMPTTWLVEHLVAETEQLHPLIVATVDDWLAAGRRGVVEGEGVEPALSVRWPTPAVRSVFVIEDDAEYLYDTFATRASAARFRALSEPEQHAVVAMNLGYGAWLREQAEAHDQPWVSSRPLATLAARVMTSTA